MTRRMVTVLPDPDSPRWLAFRPSSRKRDIVQDRGVPAEGGETQGEALTARISPAASPPVSEPAIQIPFFSITRLRIITAPLASTSRTAIAAGSSTRTSASAPLSVRP